MGFVQYCVANMAETVRLCSSKAVGARLRYVDELAYRGKS